MLRRIVPIAVIGLCVGCGSGSGPAAGPEIESDVHVPAIDVPDGSSDVEEASRDPAGDEAGDATADAPAEASLPDVSADSEGLAEADAVDAVPETEAVEAAGETDAAADAPDGVEPAGCTGGTCAVPAGKAWIGCRMDGTDPECNCPSGMACPYHQADTPAYRIDRTEVTVSAFGACVDAATCTAPATLFASCGWNDRAGRADRPVDCITWDQARAYCAWAGKRLCSETEWEKAARGPDGRPYPWGNDPPTCDRVAYSACGRDGPAAVGTTPGDASPYGVLDMAGNVSEWVEDDFHGSWNGAPTDGTAWVDSPRGTDRIAKGGEWDSGSAFLVLTLRGPVSPTFKGSVGVRCCLEAP